MRKLSIIIVLLTIVTILNSCKKNVQDPTYTGESRIFLRGPLLGLASTDTRSVQDYRSTELSFAVVPSSRLDSTITLAAQCVGGIVDYDRKFAVVVDEEQTTALPDEYELISDLIIPANKYQGMVKVKLKRSWRIASASIKLVVKVVETPDFKVNSNNLNIPTPNVALQTSYAFSWTGELVKPVNWDGTFGLRNYLGVYSKLKHQLIVDYTPYGATFETFLTTGNFTKQKYQMQSWIGAYVASYNAANPTSPLKNENGVAIGICSGCP